jgi:hypothetical protein
MNLGVHFFCLSKRNEPNLPDLTATAGREKDSPDNAPARSQKILKI